MNEWRNEQKKKRATRPTHYRVTWGEPALCPPGLCLAYCERSFGLASVSPFNGRSNTVDHVAVLRRFYGPVFIPFMCVFFLVFLFFNFYFFPFPFSFLQYISTFFNTHFTFYMHIRNIFLYTLNIFPIYDYHFSIL